MRLSRVDVLRAIAVLLVMVHHLAAPPDYAPRWAVDLVEFAQNPSWIGVDLFFVLSGFLVSGLLFREHQLHGDLRGGRFLIRRGFKIYPAYYLFLFATFFFGTYPRRAPSSHNLLVHGVFLANYADWMPGIWAHTWSLAVEEHFYILLAGFMAWRFRPGARIPTLREAVNSFGIVAALVLVARVLTTASILTDPTRGRIELHYFATHLRIDALLFGVLLSFIYHYRPDVWTRLTAPRRSLAAASALLLGPALFFPGPHPFTVTIGYTLYYVAFGILLALVLPRPGEQISARPIGRVERTLAMIGTYSYSIYLWHTASKHWSAPVWKAVVGQELGYVGQAVLYFASSLALGIAMARLIELPFLRIRDLAFPSRSSPAEPSTPRIGYAIAERPEPNPSGTLT